MREPSAPSVPRLLLIADGFATGRTEMDAAAIRQRTLGLVRAGVPWVSLRDPDADESTFLDVARDLARALRDARPDVLVSVHARRGVALEIGAGLHVGRRGATLSEALAAGLDGPVGVSAHSATQVMRAQRGGATYATLSPLFETRSHPSVLPLGLGPLRLAASRARVPVLALGGLTPRRAHQTRACGAHGVAAISSLLFSWDEAETVAAFLEAVTPANPTVGEG